MSVIAALDSLSRHILNSEECLRLVSYFVYNFSIKMALVLYSIKWPDVIAWLSLLLEILGNTRIAIVCFPAFDVITLKISKFFLKNLVLLPDQNLKEKFEYLENEKSF